MLSIELKYFPLILTISTLMGSRNFMLSFEHEKSFIILGPEIKLTTSGLVVCACLTPFSSRQFIQLQLFNISQG